MDDFYEKKWFVYFGDHHEGPFSLEEVRDRMGAGQLTVSNYVWAEGMPDWKIMTQVEAFESLISPPPSLEKEPLSSHPDLEYAPSEIQPEARRGAVHPSGQTSSGQSNGPVLERVLNSPIQLEQRPAAQTQNGKANHSGKKQGTSPTATIGPAHPGRPEDEDALLLREEEEAFARDSRSRRNRRLFKTLFLGSVVLGLAFAVNQGYLDSVLRSPGSQAAIQTGKDAVQPYLLKLTDQFPVLGKWVSPIPFLEDATPEEYEELKKAATLSDPPAIRLALALAQADPTSPVFYLGSTLPDGSRIDVYVEGVPDTLLNQLSFTARTQAVISKKFGKTAPIKFEIGKPLSRGQYMIYAIESEDQPAAVKAVLNALPAANTRAPDTLPRGFKLIASKSYFLGGKKDATYTARLKEFHDKLTAKAANELSEVKQFSMTLEGQLNSTLEKFKGLARSKPSFQRRKTWEDFGGQWNRLQGQLNQSFAKWTPEALQKEYFYGSLYQLALQSGQAIEKVEQAHNAFFTTTVDSSAFEIQLGQAVSAAQSAINGLKAKIEQAEKIPPSPNGMPRKEGL